jgi:RNA polymerase sigma factor (sigma-70 family)
MMSAERQRPPTSDEQLAGRAAVGDRAAFATIFERHHRDLYRRCRTVVGNSHDAEDALQNTMAAALKALPGETRKIALRPWLRRVARNESLLILRRGRPLADQVVLLEDAVGTAATAATEAENRDRLRQLLADLAALPERQRSALLMRALGGHDYPAIGGALGASEQAARQAVYAARVSLAEIDDGRAMDCASARRAISAQDRRLLRGRRIRSHLGSCEGCGDFGAEMSSRRVRGPRDADGRPGKRSPTPQTTFVDADAPRPGR